MVAGAPSGKCIAGEDLDDERLVWRRHPELRKSVQRHLAHHAFSSPLLSADAAETSEYPGARTT